MNNRKARLLLRVPANVDGSFCYFKLSNRVSEIRRKGAYWSTHVDDSRAMKRRRKSWERQRDEAAAKWRALGLNVRNEYYRPDMFGGRDGTSVRPSHR